MPHYRSRFQRLPSLLPAMLIALLASPALIADEEPAPAPLQGAQEATAAPEPALPTAGAADDKQKALPLPIDEVRVFTQVLEQIRNAYIEELDDKTLLQNAIKGMLAGIDPHSTYLEKEAFEQLNESTMGEFGGLGVEVTIEDGLIKIIAPIEDSPADRAGIQAGDMIIKIDDQPVREVTLTDTVDLMRGEPGTEVELTIVREGSVEPLEITVTRAIITARNLRHRNLEPGYGYIRIAQFAANTGDEMRKAIVTLLEENEPLKGIVLDLRNNPGGVLQSAVQVADAFIDEGLIVYTEGRLEEAEMRFEATPNTPAEDVPLVVLINGGSASASEIVAGALQDHGRAVIMGTASFGKGSVQTVLPLTEERAIKLTTALYYTPSGRSIQARGILPDIEVERGQVTRAPRSITAYRESDLENHLENRDLSTESAVPASGLTGAEEVIVSDYQLNEALNLLKGLNIALRRL